MINPSGILASTFRVEMYSESLGEPWLNEDLIARVRERMCQLRGQWNATGYSKTMDC